MNSQPKAGFVDLVSRGEPFRLLFPLGILLGVCGVLLWPAHLWAGWDYPVLSHPAIMIEGFLGSFILGFLGTAMPRILEVRSFGLLESVMAAGALLTSSILHLTGAYWIAETVFFLLITGFAISMLVRAGARRDNPPPGFILVATGIGCAISGSLITAIARLAPAWLAMEWAILGKLLLQQGFVLMPFMGVGGWFLPRFFDLPNRPGNDPSGATARESRQQAYVAAAVGMVIIFSFVLESIGWWRTGFALRAASFAYYLLANIPLHRIEIGGGACGWIIRISLAMVLLAYLSMAFLPGWRVSLVHFAFIGGFSLLVFVVATRVIFGHSGALARRGMPRKLLISITILLVVAALTRVTADWMPAIRMTHYAYAAIAWAAAALLWILFILPLVRIPDEGRE